MLRPFGHKLGDDPAKLCPCLKQDNMTTPFNFRVCDALVVGSKILGQHLAVHHGDQLIDAAMHDLDPFSSYRIRKHLQLLGTFMMPSDRDGLKQKAFSGEAVDILPLI